MLLKTRGWNTKTTKWLIVVCCLLLIFSGWLWYKKAYLSNYRVFWGMISNNLATNGLTRQVQSINSTQITNQYTRIELDSQKASQVLEIVKQSGTNNSFTQESIGTPTADYARYVNINTGQRNATGKLVNYSGVEGVWGKAESSESGQLPAQYFNQAILGTIPVANLQPSQRASLIKMIHQQGVFNVNYNKVTKQKDNNTAVYTYNVAINPRPYFIMMQQFVKELGLNDSIVPNPGNYTKVPPLELQISIKPASRELEKIHYVSNDQDEMYSGYGQSLSINLPTKTISLNELQQRISQAK